MSPRVVFLFLSIALSCHGYTALPTVESTTESKSTTPKGQLEAKAGGISVRFGNFEATDGDELMFPGISNRAFGSFGSASSSSPSSSSDSSSSSASSSSSSSSNSIKKVGGESIQRASVVRPGRPAELQRAPASPCQTCCNSNPCGGVPLPYVPDQGAYRPPPPPQFVGSDGYYPDYGGRHYPGFAHGGSGSYSNSQASSSSGYKHGANGYQQGGNQVFPGYPGGSFGPSHVGGGNPYYPSRPVGSGSSASSSANSYSGSNNGGYPSHPGYPGVPGFNQLYPGGYSGSFSSSSSSSSAAKGGSFSSSSSQSGSVSGNPRPVRPVIPPTVPEVTPEFSLPDGMCRSSAC